MNRLKPLIGELKEQARFPYTCTTENKNPNLKSESDTQLREKKRVVEIN
jgi:hypothetical protein